MTQTQAKLDKARATQQQARATLEQARAILALAQVMADLHGLEMDCLVVTHDGDLHATRAKNQRRGRQ